MSAEIYQLVHLRFVPKRSVEGQHRRVNACGRINRMRLPALFPVRSLNGDMDSVKASSFSGKGAALSEAMIFLGVLFDRYLQCTVPSLPLGGEEFLISDCPL